MIALLHKLLRPRVALARLAVEVSVLRATNSLLVRHCNRLRFERVQHLDELAELRELVCAVVVRQEGRA